MVNDAFSRITRIPSIGNKFTYSVAAIRRFPERSACWVENGAWSSIRQSDDTFDSLVGFNKLFALGLSDEQSGVVQVHPFYFVVVAGRYLWTVV